MSSFQSTAEGAVAVGRLRQVEPVERQQGVKHLLVCAGIRRIQAQIETFLSASEKKTSFLTSSRFTENNPVFTGELSVRRIIYILHVFFVSFFLQTLFTGMKKKKRLT